jgi:hypothetical protein
MWEMNSVTYLSVEGMTPAAPFVLFGQKRCLAMIWQTNGAVTTLPPLALTSFTAMAMQLRYSIPGNTGVVRRGTICNAWSILPMRLATPSARECLVELADVGEADVWSISTVG